MLIRHSSLMRLLVVRVRMLCDTDLSCLRLFFFFFNSIHYILGVVVTGKLERSKEKCVMFMMYDMIYENGVMTLFSSFV